MEDQLQNVNQSGTILDNQSYVNEGIVKYRLDTNPLLQDIELVLSGRKTELIEDNEGKPVVAVVQIAKPKVNDEGLQSIKGIVRLMLSSPLVQGNFMVDSSGYSEEYEKAINQIHKDLASDLVSNSKEWGISDNDIEYLCNWIPQAIVIFLTRLKANKERESYSASLKSIESNTVTPSRKAGWNPFKKG